jgi:predicted dehydrogenase
MNKAIFSARKIRTGIIGGGNWARYAHIPALKLLPQYELTAIATRSRQSADEIAREHDIPYAFDNFNDLIHHPEVDLVAVLTIAPQHEAIVRAAIDAGKDVFCEWPLTPQLKQTESLLEHAEKAGVRHIVGLQRRLAPSNRYLRDLLSEGYVGTIRSVRLHVSDAFYRQQRPSKIAFTIAAENFTNAISVYGGHFMDMFFTSIGEPKEFNATIASQFDRVTVIETGETFSTSAPDQLVLSGNLKNGALLSIHVEGGKGNNFGLQVDISGTEGDLKISNVAAFHNLEDNLIEGARGEGQPLQKLPVPQQYNWLPSSELPASALELVNVYEAFARDLVEGTSLTPTFADAVKLHRFLIAIEEASKTGERISFPI